MPMVTMSFYTNTIFTRMQDNFLPLKFGTWICEAVLNLRMRHWTRPQQTGSLSMGPCRAKPSYASPNHEVRYTLFLDIMQCRVIITYQHPILNWQEIQKRAKNTNEVNWHNLLFLGLCPSPNFLKKHIPVFKERNI